MVSEQEANVLTWKTMKSLPKQRPMYGKRKDGSDLGFPAKFCGREELEFEGQAEYS